MRRVNVARIGDHLREAQADRDSVERSLRHVELDDEPISPAEAAERARVAGRTCGDCRACCKVMGVGELEKPRGVWCKHACPSGCAIYATRPPSCAEFTCAWLVGFQPILSGGVEDRPDKIKVVYWPLPGQLPDPGAGGELVHVVQANELFQGSSLGDRQLAITRRFLVVGVAVLVANDERATRCYFPSGRVVDIPATDPRGDLSRMRMLP